MIKTEEKIFEYLISGEMTWVNALLAFGYCAECIRNADRSLGHWEGSDPRAQFITCQTRNYLKEKGTSLEISVIHIF